MGQFSKVLLAIDNAHRVLQRALDCGPGVGGLNQVMKLGPVKYNLPLVTCIIQNVCKRL